MDRLLWQKRIRNYAGLLGALLPWISLLGAVIVNTVNPLEASFWRNLSISATYYVTPALAGILTTASVVLMCYDGYDRQDNVITTLSGVFGIMIVLFPCNCSIAPDFTGFFMLNKTLSNYIHCFAAGVFFCLLAYNDLFLFTKGFVCKTKKKNVRNGIYITCGIGMLMAMTLQILPIHFPAKTWVVETVALTFFGFSWLTKGGAFKFLND